MNTSFRKFNLNLFYEKIGFGFWTWSKYLDLDLNLIQIFGSRFKKIQSIFSEKMNLDWKSSLIIWI